MNAMNNFKAKAMASLLVVFAALAPLKAYSFVGSDYVRGQAQVNEFMGYLNAERQSRGLPALQLRQELCRAARLHAEDMTNRAYLAHETLGSGLTPQQRANNAGWTGPVGECVASGQSTAYQAFTEWMNSDGHRMILLSAASSGVTFGGIGFAWEKKAGSYFWDTRWVFLISQGNANDGTAGIPAETVGFPVASEWDNLIGSTWYGFETLDGAGRPDSGSTLPVRVVKVNLKQGEKVRRTSRVNPLVKVNKRVAHLKMTKGRMPSGLRLNKATGYVSGTAIKAGKSKVYLLNITSVNAQGMTVTEPVRVMFTVRK